MAKKKAQEKATVLSAPDQRFDKFELARFIQRDKRGTRSRFAPWLNRTELARVMGSTKSHVVNLLSGKVQPGIRTLESLSRAIGTDLDGAQEFLRLVVGSGGVGSKEAGARGNKRVVGRAGRGSGCGRAT